MVAYFERGKYDEMNPSNPVDIYFVAVKKDFKLVFRHLPLVKSCQFEKTVLFFLRADSC